MFLNRISNTRPLIKQCTALLNIYYPQLSQNTNFSNETTELKPTDQSTTMPKKQISKAMKAYLERAREHNEFMQEKSLEFQIGKRHLANMMGENPETFTQEDINRAIEYLFPSGLFDPKARPLMRPPEEVYPQRKAAEFDETGRPYHFLFYCGKPNFYQLLYDVVEHMNDLEKYDDRMIKKNIQPDNNLNIDMSGYKWLEKEVLEKKLVETINDKEYSYFVKTMERLVQMPYSYRLKDFILTYCQSLMSQTKTLELPKLQYDETGRAFITIYECLRKRARGHVTIRSPGTGKISVNDKDISYFHDLQSREQSFICVRSRPTSNTLDCLNGLITVDHDLYIVWSLLKAFNKGINTMYMRFSHGTCCLICEKYFICDCGGIYQRVKKPGRVKPTHIWLQHTQLYI